MRHMMLTFISIVFALFFPFKIFALPTQINSPGERLIVVSPQQHAWGAYDPSGRLIKSGLASAGANYCRDIHQPCRTRTGTFRIRSLGSSGCKSPSFPVPRGGAPMPYCMYFNESQALHGSNEVVRGNISHGCVRLHVGDARWLRNNFATYGTLVYIGPY